MKISKREMDIEFREIERRSNGANAARRNAKASLDFVMVCLVGYERPMPMAFHDNQGAIAVRVHTTKPGNYRGLMKKLQAEQALCRLKRWGHVWVGSDQHAKRLKGRLDVGLIGNASQELLEHWKDLADPELFWPILLDQAVQEIRAGGESIEFYDDEDVERAMRSKMFGGQNAR